MKKIIIYITIFLNACTSADVCCGGGKCTGSQYCTACTSCSSCKYCNSGGVCGVCSPGSFKTKPKNTSKETKKSTHSTNTNTIQVTEDLSTDTALVNSLKRQQESYKQPEEEKASAPEIFTVVEDQPEFPGGPTKMQKYIEENLIYPESAKEAGISGKCFLKFVVNGDGAISDVQILKGVAGCPDCDREAMRVVKSMPKWKAGKQNGKPVAVYYNYPINFLYTKPKK